VAFAYDKTAKTCAYYVNGVLKQTLTYTTAVNPIFTGTTNYIGAQSTSSSTAFIGRLDDFRLYNRALSGTEVTDLYNANAPTFTINASAGTGGSITPSGTITKNSGTSQAFTIAANPGYAIADVVVDTVSQGAIMSYTFNSIAANHTISAVFAKPVGMNNKSVLTDAKAQGRAVVVWGKVKSIIDLPTSFTINDGYSGDVTVNVNGVALPVGFDTTKTAIVTGVVSADKKVQAQAVGIYP
jgi:cytochrome c-type biogenesis protein CcmE